MKKQEVIEALCAIAKKVASENWDGIHPADCICKQEDDPFFQFHPWVIKYIELAVQARLNKR